MNRRAMILDDDPFILSLLALVFTRRGYTVTPYATPLSCPVHKADKCPCQIDVPCPSIILTDFDMPGANGIEFLEGLKRIGCKCPHVALMTGSRMEEADLQRVTKLKVKLIAKPFHPDQIQAWLNEIEQA